MSRGCAAPFAAFVFSMGMLASACDGGSTSPTAPSNLPAGFSQTANRDLRYSSALPPRVIDRADWHDVSTADVVRSNRRRCLIVLSYSQDDGSRLVDAQAVKTRSMALASRRSMVRLYLRLTSITVETNQQAFRPGNQSAASLSRF